MSRSLKKGPYISVKLDKKVAAMEASGKKSVIKTWSRASMISPDFVGHTFAVHNGNKFIPVYVTETWWGTNSVSSLLHAHSAAMQVTRKIRPEGMRVLIQLKN